jgi:hypothetical protein
VRQCSVRKRRTKDFFLVFELAERCVDARQESWDGNGSWQQKTSGGDRRKGGHRGPNSADASEDHARPAPPLHLLAHFLKFGLEVASYEF